MHEIMRKYNIPKSTFIRMRKEHISSKAFDFQDINRDQKCSSLTFEMKTFINRLIKPPTFPLALAKICWKINEEFNIAISRKTVEDYIKNTLNYTYKKGSSTTIRGSSNKYKIARSISAWGFLTSLLESKYIVNIDESIFNRELKQNYSWLPKGKTGQIINNIFTGSWSLIAGIWSDGQFLCMITHETINSDIFQMYLSILCYALDRRLDLKTKKVLLTLDNATVHTSNETISKLNKLNRDTSFLSAYSPMIAPVDIFFKQIKSKLRAINSWEHTNFNKELGTLKLIKQILKLEDKATQTPWIECIKNAKNIILDCY